MRNLLRLRSFSLAPLLLLLGSVALMGARAGGQLAGIDRGATRVEAQGPGSGHIPRSPDDEAPAFELELELEEVEDDRGELSVFLPAAPLIGELAPSWERFSYAHTLARQRAEVHSLSHCARAPPA